METLQIISIVLELVIALLACYGAIKGRRYLFGFALTFGIYVYYDLARLYAWEISETTLRAAFFVATLAALVSIIGLVRERVPSSDITA